MIEGDSAAVGAIIDRPIRREQAPALRQIRTVSLVGDNAHIVLKAVRRKRRTLRHIRTFSLVGAPLVVARKRKGRRFLVAMLLGMTNRVSICHSEE